MGGSEAIINALIRGLEKHGGKLLLRSHVDHIVIENERAAGVALRRRSPAPTPSNSGSSSSSSSSSEGPLEVIRARKGVVSNASVWDTHKLLAPGVGPKEWRRESVTTPQVGLVLCSLLLFYSCGFER
jgi:phytoene dehydrogenase-like protein